MSDRPNELPPGFDEFFTTVEKNIMCRAVADNARLGDPEDVMQEFAIAVSLNRPPEDNPCGPGFTKQVVAHRAIKMARDADTYKRKASMFEMPLADGADDEDEPICEMLDADVETKIAFEQTVRLIVRDLEKQYLRDKYLPYFQDILSNKGLAEQTEAARQYREQARLKVKDRVDGKAPNMKRDLPLTDLRKVHQVSLSQHARFVSVVRRVLVANGYAGAVEWLEKE